jgi:hypothetical protein
MEKSWMFSMPLAEHRPEITAIYSPENRYGDHFERS